MVNEIKNGFWAGMSTRRKARLIVWCIYWALAVWLVGLGAMIGFAMFVAPILWFIAKAWVFDTFLELDTDRDGLLNYALGFIWNASIYVRSFFMISVLAVFLGGLGWYGTEDLRREAAEPTFAERVSDSASSIAETTAEKAGVAVEATKSTTKGWAASVKGWFESDDLVED